MIILRWKPAQNRTFFQSNLILNLIEICLVRIIQLSLVFLNPFKPLFHVCSNDYFRPFIINGIFIILSLTQNNLFVIINHYKALSINSAFYIDE